MKFLYRLAFYLGGFSVGLIFLAFILNGKKTSCNYTPNARVIDNLLQKEILIPAEIISSRPKLTSHKIKKMIRRGKVNFSKSNTKKDSCNLYYIDLEGSVTSFLEVTNCKKALILISFNVP